jgi:hemoglobin
MATDQRGDAFRDLDRRAEIHDLVIDFYREIALDPELGRVFGEVAEVDWAIHIPRLISYWARVLLGEPGYDGYILRPHQYVHGLEPLELRYFDRWYELWVDCVDARWRGPVAEAAKGHAARMAKTLARRILDLEWPATEASNASLGSSVDARQREELRP